MIYGDRISAKHWKTIAARQERYLCYLKGQLLDNKTDIIRYFASEVFHDGKMKVMYVSIEQRMVAIRFTNVYAKDSVQRSLVSNNRLIGNVFHTMVEFGGVSRVMIDCSLEMNHVRYYQSEILIRGDQIQVTIWMKSISDHIRSGRLQITCRTIKVEDISTKIVTQYGRKIVFKTTPYDDGSAGSTLIS